MTNHAWKDGVKILEDFNPIWVSAFKELRAKTVGEVEYVAPVFFSTRWVALLSIAFSLGHVETFARRPAA